MSELLNAWEEQHVEHVTDLVLREIHRRGAAAAFAYDDEAAQRYDAHAAEYILARTLDLRWNTLDHIADPGYIDVGDQDEVRHRRYPNASLILYPGDNPELRYHLYGGLRPSYVHRGWMWGRDGMVHRYWVEAGTALPDSGHVVRRGGFFIPQHHLRRLAELLPPPPPPEPEPVQPSTIAMFYE